jgi:hypothetical protein
MLFRHDGTGGGVSILLGLGGLERDTVIRETEEQGQAASLIYQANELTQGRPATGSAP